MLVRRDTLKLFGAGLAVAATGARAAPTPASPKASGVQWWSTTAAAAWQQSGRAAAFEAAPADLFQHDIMLGGEAQTMTGMGGAFSELGWQALSALPAADRDAVMRLLFGADGAAFTMCRTPIGANDFARDWYSYDEVDGDFAMAKFSIARDREMLLPFINAAQKIQPDLKVWGSPWSPPTWMKVGKHYAQAPTWPGVPSNGIRPDQQGREGTDSFIQDDRYFAAYALYFRKYVEAYRAAGVPISMVMPQNEFNSAQPYPSCCWTPEGLARFIPFLAREMGAVGVDVMLGTLERSNPDLITKVLNDSAAAKHIKGIGIQWAGKGAIEEIRRRHPDLALIGTEHECGVGANDWHFASYGWDLMKRYIRNGTGVWQYWNMVCPTPGVSTWGWRQNSLISVDVAKRQYRINPDYWLMKHLSGKLVPGARFVTTNSIAGFEDHLIFRNPNGDLVVVLANQMAQDQLVRLVVGPKMLALTLTAGSFNTLVVPQSLMA